MADQELLALVKRLEAVATRLEGSAPGGETSGKSQILKTEEKKNLVFDKNPLFCLIIMKHGRNSGFFLTASVIFFLLSI